MKHVVFLILHSLVCAVEALILNTSPRTIYYRLGPQHTRGLSLAINWYDTPSRINLWRLLSSREFPSLRLDYAALDLNELIVLDLLRFFSEVPETHAVMIPFDFYVKDDLVHNCFVGRLDHYRPGAFRWRNSGIRPGLGPNIERLIRGRYNLVYSASLISTVETMNNFWELHEDIDRPKFVQLMRQGDSNLVLLSTLYSLLSRQLFSPIYTEDIRRIYQNPSIITAKNLATLTVGGTGWHTSYLIIHAYISYSVGEMSLRCLWWSKLLLLTLMCPISNQMDMFSSIIIDYFQSIDPKETPLYLMRRVIETLMTKGLQLDPEISLSLEHKLQLIDELLPDAPPFWGYTLEHYTKKVFRTIRSLPEEESLASWDKHLAIDEAIRLWAQQLPSEAEGVQVSALRRTLKINLSSFPRLKFIKTSIRTRPCTHFMAFLRTISQTLQEHLHLRGDEPNFAIYCRAIVRTMGANLLYTNELGFFLTVEEIERIYDDDPTSLGGMFQCIRNVLRSPPFDVIPRRMLYPTKEGLILHIFVLVAALIILQVSYQ